LASWHESKFYVFYISMYKQDIITALLIAAVVVGSLTIWVRNGARERAMLEDKNKPEEIVEEAKDLYVLAGPTWVWSETKYSDGKVVTPTKAGIFSIKFDSKEGHIFGTTDCNGFSMSYTSSAWGRLALGPGLSTLMFCEGSQEVEFRKMVEESDRYIFTESGDLVLLLKLDSGSVLFKKQ